MQQMTLQEIACAVGAPGTYTGAVDAISTDTRALEAGCLFIALAGERFNGHDYIAQALAGGASFAIAHEKRDYGSSRVLYVKDTQQALMDIAAAYRRKFSIECIGITGSVGKTTTKEMVAQVVSAGYHTLKTHANLNNEIGLSKTILSLEPTHQAAVIEMGMQGLGEIADLARIAAPGIGIITNIGVSHIMQLGSRENILKAKMELADALPDGAPLLLCADNDLLRQVKDERLQVIFYGTEQINADYFAKDIKECPDGTSFTICHETEEYAVAIPCLGVHNVQNALAAFAVGHILCIPAETCVKALAGYEPSGMRQRVVRRKGYTVVEDCYNASPDSMRAALRTLGDFACEGKRIAVLADMLELGELSEQAHRDIGAFAAQCGIDLLLAYGDAAWYYTEGANQAAMRALHYPDQDSLLRALLNELALGDVVWVKGSHGMHLENLLEKLYKEETENS